MRHDCHPVDAIAAYGGDRADIVIVMATHGRSGLRSVVMGSVVQGVTMARCPVLVGPPRATPRTLAPVGSLMDGSAAVGPGHPMPAAQARDASGRSRGAPPAVKQRQSSSRNSPVIRNHACSTMSTAWSAARSNERETGSIRSAHSRRSESCLWSQHLAQQLAVELIDVIIELGETLAHLAVSAGECLDSHLGHGYGGATHVQQAIKDPGHLRKGGRRSRGLGDVDCDVANALKVERHMDQRNEETEIRRDGLLTAHQVDGAPFDLLIQKVDVVIGSHHRCRQRLVGFGQGLHRQHE